MRDRPSGRRESCMDRVNPSMPNSSKDKKAPDSPAEIMRSLIQRHLTSTLARYAPTATPRDWWIA